ncbi:hypothetical protein [Deferrisoma camini]|uniref:hypothetical protein n=1 Tax=Deferrisoma camini TaxID=1035120 RepID=UPI00046CA65F|nr:hypothetical protein [Deferrisoma camini]
MSVAVSFERRPAVSRLLDPRQGFSPAAAPVEVRRDPVTGRTVRVGHFGAVRPVPLDLERYAAPEVKGHCPFCPGNRERELPRFDPAVIPGGRLEAGEAVLAPNLFPYDVHGAVCVLTRDHVVGLEGLTRRRLADGLGLGLAYWKAVGRADPRHRYPVMAWNYMPPSGGGLVHPHIQFFRFDIAPRALAEALEATARHPGVWAALAEAERARDERYLGRTGPWEWWVPFAPVGIWGEVWALAPGLGRLEALESAGWGALLDGLGRVLACFADAGIHSFNAALFVGPDAGEPLPAQLRIVPRTHLNLRDFAPDLNFFQAVLEEPVCAVWPEDLARQLRPYF